jgi:hypothetical protein
MMTFFISLSESVSTADDVEASAANKLQFKLVCHAPLYVSGAPMFHPPPRPEAPTSHPVIVHTDWAEARPISMTPSLSHADVQKLYSS